MYLNQIKPAEGAKTKRFRPGRGIGCGAGKTCGRGHKGQTSRTGGYRKVGFEGGQTPLQRRLPKSGFVSRKSLVSHSVRLSELNKVNGDVVSLETLHEAGVISHVIKFVRIFASGKIDRALKVVGIPVTAGALELIKAAGGSVELGS
jgi:large subunit ribosomal protein L15